MNGTLVYRWSALAFGLLLFGNIAHVSAQAQNNTGYLSVTGVGQVDATPDVLELHGTISSSGELASDAMTTFATVKEEALASLKELDVEGMTVETSGLNIGTGAAAGVNAFLRLQQPGVAAEPPQVSVSESLLIQLKGIDELDTEQLLGKMVKIIDAAKEAGITFGTAPTNISMVAYARTGMPALTAYKLAESDTLREQATEQAMKQARARAERLAKLAGGRAGKVRTVIETQNRSYTYGPMGAQLQGESSAVRQKITVQVSITVQFELLW